MAGFTVAIKQKTEQKKFLYILRVLEHQMLEENAGGLQNSHNKAEIRRRAIFPPLHI